LNHLTDEGHVDVPCVDGRTLLGSSCAPENDHDDAENTGVWLVFSPGVVPPSFAPSLYDASRLRSDEVISDSLASWLLRFTERLYGLDALTRSWW